VIGVTGASSGIGRAVLETAQARGLDAVALGRSQDSNIRPYDLSTPLPVASLTGLQAVIHLAWSWAADGRQNVHAGRELAGACQALGIRPVLLSTFSAFAAASSQYGADKAALETTFTESGGAALRAGLIWGGRPAGMVATLSKLSRLPIAAARLLPDPQMYHSHERDLASALLQAALGEKPRDVVLAASREPVSLALLMKQLRGCKVGITVPVPTRGLAGAARGLESLRVRLPFRADSIASLERPPGPGLSSEESVWGLSFHGSAAFLEWAGQL
jgi:nucleoside-diphosphate-sugar epimerase